MSYARGKHIQKKRRKKKKNCMASSQMDEHAITEIKLIALPHAATQGRFRARTSFAYDKFIPCLKLAKLFKVIQSYEIDVPLVLLVFIMCLCRKNI